MMINDVTETGTYALPRSHPHVLMMLGKEAPVGAAEALNKSPVQTRRRKWRHNILFLDLPQFSLVENLQTLHFITDGWKISLYLQQLPTQSCHLRDQVRRNATTDIVLGDSSCPISFKIL